MTFVSDGSTTQSSLLAPAAPPSSVATSSSAAPPSSAAAAGRRLAWLDALRGWRPCSWCSITWASPSSSTPARTFTSGLTLASSACSSSFWSAAISCRRPWSARALALMFTGTMLYRAERGDFGKRKAVVVTVAVFALARWPASGIPRRGISHARPPGSRTTGSGSPRCCWPGRRSRSAWPAGTRRCRASSPGSAWSATRCTCSTRCWCRCTTTFRSPGTRIRSPSSWPLAAAFLAVLLLCCWLSYRCIEAPMQRQGRKFAVWLEYRFGPDAIPGRQHRRADARRADTRQPDARQAGARQAESVSR